jgi:hypothetical protein
MAHLQGEIESAKARSLNRYLTSSILNLQVRVKSSLYRRVVAASSSQCGIMVLAKSERLESLHPIVAPHDEPLL